MLIKKWCMFSFNGHINVGNCLLIIAVLMESCSSNGRTREWVVWSFFCCLFLDSRIRVINRSSGSTRNYNSLNQLCISALGAYTQFDQANKVPLHVPMNSNRIYSYKTALVRQISSRRPGRITTSSECTIWGHEILGPVSYGSVSRITSWHVHKIIGFVGTARSAEWYW